MSLALVSLLFSTSTSRLQTPEVRLYVLDGGRGRLPNSALLNDTYEPSDKQVDLADPCFLIKHGDKWLLWDTGLPDSLVGHPQDSPLVHLEKDHTMAEELQKVGLTPAQVDFVAFSHSHFDHTGTLSLFTSSTWIVQRAEMKHAQSEPAPFSVVPDLLSGFAQAKKIEVSGDYDVFGDGTVEMLLTPGHTPGHMSLLVKLPHMGPVVLSGDLWHQRISFEKNWVPSINENRAETLASMDRVKAILKNLHARLIVQHDPGDYAKLPKAPAFLN